MSRHRSTPRADRRLTALELQKQGHFVDAINLYDSVLQKHPADWDVAHMRAVALFQLGLLPEARSAFAALLSSPATELPAFWTNLGLLIAAIASDPLSAKSQRGLVGLPHSHRPAEGRAPDSTTLPTVSVVMPTYNHAGYVEQAIDSVFAQSFLPAELIVIDDGSMDNTAEVCRRALADAPIPVIFISRENRGTPATLNQGIEQAHGEFIQPLNSDDLLPASRIEVMLSRMLERGGDWGFSRVSYVDASGNRLDPGQHPRARSLTAVQDSVVMSGALGLGLLRANAAISSGNLIFRKTLWQAAGGFRDFRYNHDWDFCLRASLESEPILVPEELYEYRIHATNTITESDSSPRLEHKKMMAEFIIHSQGPSTWPNPFAPTLANWGNDYLALLGATDSLRHLPVSLVEQFLSHASATSPKNR
jgi:glycosyltransferase involved in cell wall biosynthesis